jgi:hypothetical protein
MLLPVAMDFAARSSSPAFALRGGNSVVPAAATEVLIKNPTDLRRLSGKSKV